MSTFKVDIEAAETLRQFDELQKNFAELPNTMSTEFWNWQAEDMHRSHPTVEGGGDTVSTEVFPRGRRRVRVIGYKPKPKSRPIIRRALPGGAHRPILRPELFKMLCDRMNEMLKEFWQWR